MYPAGVFRLPPPFSEKIYSHVLRDLLSLPFDELRQTHTTFCRLTQCGCQNIPYSSLRSPSSKNGRRRKRRRQRKSSLKIYEQTDNEMKREFQNFQHTRCKERTGLSLGNRCGIYQTQDSRNIYRQEMQATSSYLRFEQQMDNRSGKYATLAMDVQAGNRQKHGTFNPHTSPFLSDDLEVQEQSFVEGEYISTDLKARLSHFMGRKSHNNNMTNRNFRRRKSQSAFKSCTSPLLRDKFEFTEPTFKEQKQQSQRRNFRNQRRNFRARICQKRGTFNPHTSHLLREDLDVQEPNFSTQAQNKSSDYGSRKGNFTAVIRKPQGNSAKNRLPASSNAGNKRGNRGGRRKKSNNRWESAMDTVSDLESRLRCLRLKNPFASVIGE